MSLTATSTARRHSRAALPWLIAWAAFLLLTLLVWLGSDQLGLGRQVSAKAWVVAAEASGS